jgi:ribose/xylose/arabinose/galactoside ABC-type transport system permease subunit
MSKIDNYELKSDKEVNKGLSAAKIYSFLGKSMLGIILIFSLVIFSILSPYFLSLKNLYAVGLTVSVIGIVCIGQTFCILIRGFDLSVGFIAAFSGMMVAYVTSPEKLGMPYFLALAIGLGIGALVGLINGLLITKGKINALITTLATGFMLAGGVVILSKGYSIIVDKPDFLFLGTTKVSGVPLPMIILIIFYIIFHIILKYTIFGRRVYCIGGNPSAARIAGINVEKMHLVVYTLSGFLAAFAGIVLTSRMGAAQTTVGTSYAMDSIAATVLGGTVLAGGEGKIFGTLIGVIIIGILANGLIMLGINQAYRDIATGLVLLLAVLLQNVNTKRA